MGVEGADKLYVKMRLQVGDDVGTEVDERLEKWSVGRDDFCV